MSDYKPEYTLSFILFEQLAPIRDRPVSIRLICLKQMRVPVPYSFCCSLSTIYESYNFTFFFLPVLSLLILSKAVTTKVYLSLPSR